MQSDCVIFIRVAASLPSFPRAFHGFFFAFTFLLPQRLLDQNSSAASAATLQDCATTKKRKVDNEPQLPDPGEKTLIGILTVRVHGRRCHSRHTQMPINTLPPPPHSAMLVFGRAGAVGGVQCDPALPDGRCVDLMLNGFLGCIARWVVR